MKAKIDIEKVKAIAMKTNTFILLYSPIATLISKLLTNKLKWKHCH